MTGAEFSPSAEKPDGCHRVLVVEDDYFVSMTICDVLAAAGHTVLGPAVSGEEAIEIALDSKPDLVLMDIRLGGQLDGIEAATTLKHSDIPSIFVTANADPQTRERGQSASPLGWVEKPFSSARLLEAVAAALAN